MQKEKAPRNKTIDTAVQDGAAYLARCIRVENEIGDPAAIQDKTVLGDTFSVCPLLPRECFDLIIADPPYNLTKLFNGSRFVKKDACAYENYTRQWLSAVCPLLKPGGSIYVCCDWETSIIIGRVLSDYCKIRNRITWQREKGRGAKANWKNGLEDIWSNFWDDITIPFWSMPENTAHPTQKPEKLIAKIILASSNPGDFVFDPFLGSGTTSVVAKKTGRHYLGIESEAQYCLWAEHRLEEAEKSTDIQGYHDGIFWDRNMLPEKDGRTKR